MSQTQRKPVTRIGAERLVVGGVETVHLDLMDRLARLVRDMHPDHIWTVRMVSERLIEAVKLCNRITGRVGPAGNKAGWPTTLKEWSDLLAQVETDEVGKQQPERRPVSATRAQIGRMEQAIRWQSDYLNAQQHEGLRRVLAVWLRCKARKGATFREELKRRGWSAATSYRCRDRALLIIAIGLMSDNVLPGGSP